jgi:hypothetical protein
MAWAIDWARRRNPRPTVAMSGRAAARLSLNSLLAQWIEEKIQEESLQEKGN